MQTLALLVGTAVSRYSYAALWLLMLAVVTALPTPAAAQQINPVSVGSNGAISNSSSAAFDTMSADGRFVLFNSASSLVPDDTNNQADAFVRDLQLGTTTRVSLSSNGGQIPPVNSLGAGAGGVAISADGRFVLFATRASLVPEDTNGHGCFIGDVGVVPCNDLYMYDRQTQQTTLVSQSTAGVVGNNDTYGATMSDDGRFVLFQSTSTNLAPDTQTQPLRFMFLRDRLAGTTTAVALPNVGPNDARLNGARISGDGKSILYGYEYFGTNPAILAMCPNLVCALAAVFDRATG